MRKQHKLEKLGGIRVKGGLVANSVASPIAANTEKLIKERSVYLRQLLTLSKCPSIHSKREEDSSQKTIEDLHVVKKFSTYFAHGIPEDRAPFIPQH